MRLSWRVGELHVGGHVLQLIPFLDEIALKEIPVADQPDFAVDLPLGRELLAVLPEEAVAVVLFGSQRSAVSAEIVFSVVADRPSVQQTFRMAGNGENGIAEVIERSAVAESAFAEVIEADAEVGSFRRLLDSEQLIAAPIGKHLHAVHFIVTRPGTADVIGRIPQVGLQIRPIEDRNRSEEEEIIRCGDFLLMVDDGLIGFGIEDGQAAPRIDQRRFNVLEIDIFCLNSVTRLAHPAGRQKTIMGKVTSVARLLNEIRFQADESFVLRGGG